jgi:hypothetical protein
VLIIAPLAPDQAALAAVTLGHSLFLADCLGAALTVDSVIAADSVFHIALPTGVIAISSQRPLPSRVTRPIARP